MVQFRIISIALHMQKCYTPCGPGVDLTRGRLAMRLTDKIVAGLPVPASGNHRTPDSEVRGLNVQISAAGHRAFVLRYRHQGKSRQLTIGTFPVWLTAAARTRAKELRRLIDQGIDPLAQEAEASTLAAFWNEVYGPLHVSAKRPSWADDIRSMMAHDILPRLGARAVKGIDRADIAALHRCISERAPTRANRVLAVLSSLMNLAEHPHVLEDGSRLPALRQPGTNPVRGVRRNAEQPRERFLSPAELARLATALDARRNAEPISVALIRFLLLTGARFGEAARATWSQFDLDRSTWTKPSSHTKQKRAHTVPLSAPALALLAELPRGGVYLFPGPTDRPITTVKTLWAAITREAGIEDMRVHDLRHSFASVLLSGGASLPLIGRLLGHSQVATTQRYAHLADDVERAAVERVGAVLSAPMPAAPVVPLRRQG
jgi:integrase